ncbi:ABC transporter ATP-binding protein [Marinomonas sp. TI.3.20]|uniref:ABC transporter ATP-binding protein n=1 Tax=Marinomonas sp. TI.3.20 TaxID=3121296 RepID=UPI00311D540D
MFKIIKKLFFLLTPQQRKQFYMLQILVVIMAFTELLGIASIAPFMALVGNISLLKGNGVFATLYTFSDITRPTDFLFYTGLAVLCMLTLSTIISMLTIWKLSLYGAKVGTEIADRLYCHYMKQNWLFHASGSSAHLTKQVSTEALRVTDGIVQPLMQMNAKVVLAIFISIGILIYDPIVAISGLLLFVCSYFVLYRLVKKRLALNGVEMSAAFTERFRLMNEGFGGIKDVLLLNRRYDFVDRFERSGVSFSNARGANIAISQVPRYFIELVAFGSMIGLVLLLIKLNQGNLGAVLPILAVYALAAFKLLPALQQIYSSVAIIKGNLAAFDSIKEDLEQSFREEPLAQTTNPKDSPIASAALKQAIYLSDITFTYPNKPTPAVNNFTMTIPANQVVGLVGASGSGKSTAIDLLLGLLTPQQGKLKIDGKVVTETNKRQWQNTIGFVPQSIFLSEGSIAENVAFGFPVKDINLEQVNKALQLAHLTELVEQLPNGVNTKVGERGVQLSGGQRQRIGIARALYYDASVLVFDEATSALDGITEKIIMEAIHDFSGQKTIIMIAHRLKTVQKCDIIYLVEQGKIIAQGTYDQLVENNAQFREMAEHA